MTAPVYPLQARTNCTFRLTRDLSRWAQTFDLTTVVIRMQARLSASSPDYIYEWVTDGTEQGSVTFDPVTGLCVWAAPEADMAEMPARLVYDAVLEHPGGIEALFSGTLTFAPGVTRGAAHTGRTAWGDTVTVSGELGSVPGVLPVSLTAAVAAAQEAAARVTPDGIAAQVAALSPSNLAAFAQLIVGALPNMTGQDVPVGAGQSFCSPSGFFVRAAGSSVIDVSSSPEIVRLVASMSPSDQLLFAQMIVGALPDMSQGDQAAAPGDVMFGPSGFLQRAL